MSQATSPRPPIELRNQLHALPSEQRLVLACELWDSLTDVERLASAVGEEQTWQVIQQRLQSLDSGAAADVDHGEMMSRIRRLFGWKSDITPK